jgi:hypothetical protein
MNPWMHVSDKTPCKFQVGDRVRLRYGFPGVIGEIVEDHGRILAGARRLYTVKLPVDEWNDFITERPEESLEGIGE